MSFFEGRVYKPQGKDLNSSVLSRVPVTIGSLSVQDDKLYYCKSCVYDSTTKLYTLSWNQVYAETSYKTTSNTANGKSCVVREGLSNLCTQTEDFNSCGLKFVDGQLLPKYPASDSILAKTIGSEDVSVIDALQYATLYEIKIDGMIDTRKFHTSYSVYNNNKEKPYYNLHKTLFHQITPPNYNTATIHMYSFGASQITGTFNKAGGNTLYGYVKPLSFGDNYYSLIGAHFVFTYRTFYYAAEISNIVNNSLVQLKNIHTRGGEYENISFESVYISGGYYNNSYEDNKVDSNADFKIDLDNIKVILLRLDVSYTGDRDLANDKFMFYLKLDPSISRK